VDLKRICILEVVFRDKNRSKIDAEMKYAADLEL
jgi:hypothetical protein